MSVTERSRIGDVARIVSGALSQENIQTVLTGGACASLYTRGAYQSSDLDFVVMNVARHILDTAMDRVGFERKGNHYQHPRTRFFVEFLPGPLAIGRDIAIRPIERPSGGHSLLLLSPTDSCRDRLAAFYFWNDRQSLRVAVQIATKYTVDFDLIREWSKTEGHLSAFDEFRAEAERARHRKRSPRNRTIQGNRRFRRPQVVGRAGTL